MPSSAASSRLTPQPLKAVNDLAWFGRRSQLGLEDRTTLRRRHYGGRSTDIHHPSPTTRSRCRRCRPRHHTLRPPSGRRRWNYDESKGCCDRTRSARRRMRPIQRMTASSVTSSRPHTYRVLVDIAEEVAGNARAWLESTRTMRRKDMFTDMAIGRKLRGQIERFCGAARLLVVVQATSSRARRRPGRYRPRWFMVSSGPRYRPERSVRRMISRTSAAFSQRDNGRPRRKRRGPNHAIRVSGRPSAGRA